MLRVNQLIEIEVSDEDTVNIYRSRIEEVAEDHMILAMPNYRGLPIFLAPGTEFLTRFVLTGAVYQFKSVFRDKLRDPIPVWRVSPAYEFTKIQRRSFFRLETFLPVTLQVDNTANVSGEPGSVSAGQQTEVNLHTKDISAGGLRVISKTQFDPGTEVQVEVTLPGKIVIRSRGKVVRAEASAPDGKIYWISIEFIELDEHDRKKIVTFVFQKQLELR